MRLTSVHHVTFTVTDLDRTASWYRDVLGFDDLVRYRNEAINGTCHVLTHPDLDGFILSFMEWDGLGREPFDERTTGLDHLSFGVGDRDELERWKAQLDRREIPYSMTELPELSIVVFRDPDNIQLELCTAIVQTSDAENSSVGETGRLRLPSSEGA
jgi:glyoxylase I family protein